MKKTLILLILLILNKEKIYCEESKGVILKITNSVNLNVKKEKNEILWLVTVPNEKLLKNYYLEIKEKDLKNEVYLFRDLKEIKVKTFNFFDFNKGNLNINLNVDRLKDQVINDNLDYKLNGILKVFSEKKEEIEMEHLNKINLRVSLKPIF